MAEHSRTQLPSLEGVEHDEEWVAWGHGSTKTRTKRRSSGLHSSSSGSTGHKHKHKHSKHKHHKSRRRFHISAGKVVAIVVAVLVVALVACLVFLGATAFGLYRDAQGAMDEASQLQECLTSGDASGAQAAAGQLQESAEAMAGAVDNPVWAVASALPLVGTDFANAATLCAVVDDLASDALVPLVEEGGGVDLGSLMSDGAVDVEALCTVATVVVDMAPVVQEATDEVEGLEHGRLDRLNDVIDQLDEAMGGMNALCQGIAALEPYLSDMLGAEGTRTYLVLAHNVSEIKSTGGFIGSVGTCTVSDGVMTLGEFSSFNDADVDVDDYGNTEDRLYVTEEEDALFSWTYGTHAGDSGVNPDFSREGELSKEFWERLHPEDAIDGVVALDSHVLADFLGLVGSVTTSDGVEVTSENCVQYLGNDVYWEYFSAENYTETSSDDSDAVFAEVARLAFNKLLGNIGGSDLMSLASVLGDNASEYRLLVWMDDEDEEQALVDLGVSGTLSTDETQPVIGVFLQSRVASKLDWWQTCTTEYSEVKLNNDGSTTYAVTTTIRNTITADEIAAASIYLIGRQDGAIWDMVYLYAPAGGTIDSVSPSTNNKVAYYTIDGFQVAKMRIAVEPGETVTITYQVTTSTLAESSPVIRTTPLAQGGSEDD